MIYHTLSIWLEMEFTSDIFFKHQFLLIIRKLLLKTNFFGGHFLSFVAFVFFCMSKKGLFDLHQEKVLCYAQFKMYYSEESYC